MMEKIPTLTTARLLLRPFTLDDVAAAAELAGEREIAEMIPNIPHPYTEEDAENWIRTHRPDLEEGKKINCAITLKSDGRLLGAISLGLRKAHHAAEMGYWIGKPYWGRGYCTEAARELLRYGFEELELNRIEARHLTSNPASGRVMIKIGMTYEGILRELMFHRGKFRDLAVYSILRSEYPAAGC